MNAFKQALAEGRRQIGLWQALANPYTAEICAGAGFDWLLIDGEHGPNDLPLVLQQLQAVSASPTEAVVRLPWGDPVLIKQYLDIGARSLLIPMVESAAQAAGLAAACRYPPRGTRGVGSAVGRASRWNRAPHYLRDADQDICLLLQIESVEGLKACAEIARTDGVDGVFIGPSDLAAALGHLGNPGHPEVRSAIFSAIETICAAGKAAGLLAADEQLARKCLSAGASFVAVGTDVTILARGSEALARLFRDDPAPSADPPASDGIY
ncbi:MAG: 4-hydroxy-2-oxoheptanedioate aldolase [Sphingosinicella sp.]|nr:4-hydroxy-2-oxoheptanedioate aldolase [Sphingosinicella sp.]